MSHLVHAIKKLIQAVEVATSEQTRISVPIEQMEPDCAVPWMANQALFPKFYWQSRDTTEEVVALGKVRTFNEINPAYSVLSSGQRIWGGYAFPYETPKDHCLNSFFFLPQIELIRNKNQN